jgi:hypothetical protein
MQKTTEFTLEILLRQLIEKYGKDTPLCGLPDSEFFTGGLVTDLLRAVGYDEAGNITLNHLNWWSKTVSEFVDEVQAIFDAEGNQ